MGSVDICSKYTQFSCYFQIGCSHHDAVKVPFVLLPNSQNEGQFAFTTQSINMPQKLKGTLTYILKVIKNLERCQYDTVVSTLFCHLCSLAQDWVMQCHPNGFNFDYNFDCHTSSEQDPVRIILNVKSTLIPT